MTILLLFLLIVPINANCYTCMSIIYDIQNYKYDNQYINIDIIDNKLYTLYNNDNDDYVYHIIKNNYDDILKSINTKSIHSICVDYKLCYSNAKYDYKTINECLRIFDYNVFCSGIYNIYSPYNALYMKYNECRKIIKC